MSLDEAVVMIGTNANVQLPPPDPNVPQGNVEMFFLNYSADDPELAARVANRLAAVFIEESSMKRTVRAEETSGFLDQRVKESQARLATLEAELRVAKESHMGALPEQTQSNIASMTAAQNQLTAAANDLRREQDRLNTIERDINGSRPLVADAAAAPGRAAPTMSPGEARVAALEKELAEKRVTLADKHPDIVDLRDQLTRAKAAAAAEVSLPEVQREVQLRQDPAYAALLKERDQVKNNIQHLERLQKDYRDQIGRYMARVDTAPRVEQALASLQRETDLERGRYADLVKRFNAAQIEEQVEQSRGSEHFTMVADAPVPEEPVTPLGPLPRVMVMVMLLGLCLGGGLALGREYLDRSIHDARSLNDLPTPVLGEIPRISHV
jgi:polysaccharide chain length determinant protein (PEP-CTERM system associated)